MKPQPSQPESITTPYDPPPGAVEFWTGWNYPLMEQQELTDEGFIILVVVIVLVFISALFLWSIGHDKYRK